MNPQQLLLILRARYKVALLLLLATVALTAVVSAHLPRQYTAATTLVVDIRAPDPVSAMLRQPSNMATQEDIIKSDRVARRVVRVLKLEENPVVQQQWRDATQGKGQLDVWLGELLQKRLTVSPPRRDSNILTIEYTATDPAFAAAVANAYSQAYVEVAVELKVEPAKQYARWFATQGKAQREQLEKAQAQLSEFQQKRGIVAKDETLDTETARLSELSTQLTQVQAMTADARSKQRSGADTLPELLGNPVIAGLRTEIARLEARLKDAGGNLGKNHPRYRSMESELAELKQKLESETRHVAKGYSTSGSVGSDKERELRTAIEAQKKKLLELRSERDQLAVLQRDVDAAKNAYDAVTTRYLQSSLESQATQTNVFLLTPAVEPLEPSSPKVARYMLMSVLFGALLGVGVAFGCEFLDRRVRGVDDLAEMLQLPVLALIPSLPAQRPAPRLAALRSRSALPSP